MAGKTASSNLKQEMQATIEGRAKAVDHGSWFDCARDVQTGSREIANRYGIEAVAEFVSRVAQEASTGVNTVRRYLALLDFVDRRVLPASFLPPDQALTFVRSNFSGLEKISRIDKLNPTTTDSLLAKLYSGELTTRALESELEGERKKNPSATTARRGQAISSRIKELKELERDLANYARSSGGLRFFGKVNGPSFLPVDWISDGSKYGRAGYLSTAATSEQGFEEAFVKAAFASRFFDHFFLVVTFIDSFIAREQVDALNLAAESQIGLLHYTNGAIVDVREARPTKKPVRIEIQYKQLKSFT